MTVVMGFSCCQINLTGGEGEFVFDGGEFPEGALAAAPVVGVLDPGDDRVAKLVAGSPALLVQDVLLEQRMERFHCRVVAG